MVKIKNVMKRFVVTATPDISLSEAAKIMTTNKVGSIVVVKEGNPVGIVTNEDIINAIAKDKDIKRLQVKDIRLKNFIYVSPEDTVNSVTKIMIKQGVKRVPVIDKDKLVGIVSEKEIVLVSPSMMNVLSEKLKMRVESVMPNEGSISGICEICEGYSDELRNVAGKWVCEYCRD